MRKLSTFLVVGLLGGALLAACGGKSSTTTSTQSSSTSTSGASGEGSAGNGSTSGGSTSKGSGSKGSTPAGGGSLAHPSKAVTAQEVEGCKHNVQKLQGVSAETKTKLEGSCTSAKTVKAQRKVVHEACEALANRLPAGVARERALQTCRLGP